MLQDGNLTDHAVRTIQSLATRAADRPFFLCAQPQQPSLLLLALILSVSLTIERA